MDKRLELGNLLQHPCVQGQNDPNDDTRGSRLRVLAIDDDPSYLKFIKHFLAGLGFEVKTATSAEDGLQIVRDSEVDLLVVDLKMPGLNGLDTIARVRADAERRHLYSILLTARDDFQIKIEALECGFDDYLAKSSSSEEIAAKFRSAQRVVRLQRRLRRQNRQWQELALTDELTRIPNRRYLLRQTEDLLSARVRLMSVALFDLDGFKFVNDRFGHAAGDRVLSDVAAVFQRSTRDGDLVARYGGDEFAMLVSGAPVEVARQIAQRLCDSIAQLRWTVDGVAFGITATFGVMPVSAVETPTVEALIAACDAELYRNKLVRERHSDAS